MRSKLLTTLLAVLTGTALALSLPAFGKDSDAPKEAGDRWLPCEPWVMYHWVPFSERELYRATGIKHAEFKDWIRDDDRHNLGQLVRRHGKKPEAVVERLLRKQKRRISDAHYKELVRRSNALMTQGHLAQHVFFHYFHNPVLAENSRAIFGIRPGDYHRARLRGWTPREIAARGGRTMKSAQRRAMRVMAQSQTEGVRRGETTRSQANYFLNYQRRWIKRWREQSINSHRKGEFPRGYRAPKGNKLKRACTYMAGSDHIDGKYDGENYKPIGTASNSFSMLCNLSTEVEQLR